MKTRTWLIEILLLGILTPLVCAQYDPQTGRFLQRDPIDTQIGRVIFANNSSPQIVGLEGPRPKTGVISPINPSISVSTAVVASIGDEPQHFQSLPMSRIPDGQNAPDQNNEYSSQITQSSFGSDIIGLESIGIESSPPGAIDLNLYDYCFSNPINFVDPFGLCGEEFVWKTVGNHGGLLVGGKVYDFGPAGKKILPWPQPGTCPYDRHDIRNNTNKASFKSLKIKKEGQLYKSNKSCCETTCQDVQACLAALCKEWNTKTYWVIHPNCWTFMGEAKSKCCLERE